jgi:adenylate cyclase
VRRSADRIRINAQLIDAEKDNQLWAERFNGNTTDLFALQDEITRRIAIDLNLKLIGAQAARPTDNPDTLDYIFRGRAALLKPPLRENYAKAISFFDHALALHPRSVEAQSRLAIALVGRVLDDMTDSATSDINRAEELIGQALAASPDSALTHFAKGLLLRQQGWLDEAAFEFETVLAFNRNAAGALLQLGVCKAMTGSLDEAIPLAEQAIRLSPHDPGLANGYWFIGSVHLVQSHTGEAVLWLEKARAANPKLAGPRAFLASAYALKAETEHAFAELAEARRLSRDDQYSSIAHLRAAGLPGSRGYWGVPKIRGLVEATYFAGLRKAGMPEE